MMKDFFEFELRESLLNGTELDLSDFPSHSQAMEQRKLHKLYMVLKQGINT